jgi:hypothetical protein
MGPELPVVLLKGMRKASVGVESQDDEGWEGTSLPTSRYRKKKIKKICGVSGGRGLGGHEPADKQVEYMYVCMYVYIHIDR